MIGLGSKIWLTRYWKARKTGITPAAIKKTIWNPWINSEFAIDKDSFGVDKFRSRIQSQTSEPIATPTVRVITVIPPAIPRAFKGSDLITISEYETWNKPRPKPWMMTAKKIKFKLVFVVQSAMINKLMADSHAPMFATKCVDNFLVSWSTLHEPRRVPKAQVLNRKPIFSISHRSIFVK